MIKKEIAEIKRQFTPANCSISRICGCYVDGEKNKKADFKEAFLSLPEEDMFKYFELLRKNLSGTLGKNLINLEFPLAAEEEGGPHEFLLKLRNSRLQNDTLLDAFYDRIIENYDYVGNYLILLIHDAYDIPGKTSDGIEMEDASDEVYSYILCSICPVDLSKPGLSYNELEGSFQNRIRDWVVQMPELGFLFPAFNDRYTDIHSMLYYTKNATDLQEDFLKNMFGCTRIPLDADSQKETFNCLIADTLGTDCDYSVVKNIHEILNEKIEEFKDSPEPLELGKQDVRRLFEDSGVPDSRMEDFDQCYDEEVGEQTTFLATNIASSRKFNIETPDVVVKVNPEAADLVETRIIDGRQCLVIAINEHVEVNGISIAVATEGITDHED